MAGAARFGVLATISPQRAVANMGIVMRRGVVSMGGMLGGGEGRLLRRMGVSTAESGGL